MYCTNHSSAQCFEWCDEEAQVFAVEWMFHSRVGYVLSGLFLPMSEMYFSSLN